MNSRQWVLLAIKQFNAVLTSEYMCISLVLMFCFTFICSQENLWCKQYSGGSICILNYTSYWLKIKNLVLKKLSKREKWKTKATIQRTWCKHLPQCCTDRAVYIMEHVKHTSCMCCHSIFCFCQEQIFWIIFEQA